MALTTAQLAVALRIIGAETDDVPSGAASILVRQAAVARALVQAQAPGAPEDVQDEAVVRLVGFLFDQSPAMPRANNPMVASGAGSVLAPWHVSTLLFPSGAAAGAPGAGAGVDTAAVNALIQAAIAVVRQLPAGGADGQFLGREEGAPAWVAAPAGSGAGLSPAERTTLNGAVQVDSISLDGDNLNFSSGGGGSKTVELDLVPNISQSDANKVLKVDNGGTTADWRDETEELPAYAVGDAGEALEVNAAGTGLHWTPAVNKARVYAQAAAIIKGGAGVTVTPDAAKNEVLVTTGATASGNAFPASPELGDRFDLLAQVTGPYPAVLTAGTSGSGAQGMFGWFGTIGHLDLEPTRINGVLWHGSESTNPVALRGRIAVYVNASVGTADPLAITINGVRRTLSAAGAQYPHIWRTAAVANPFVDGTAYTLQIQFRDAPPSAGTTLEFPDRTFEPREYVWDGHHWKTWSALTAADIRDELQTLTGDARLPAAAVKDLPTARFETILHDGPGQGLTVSSPNNSLTSAAQLIGSPAFDLDDVANGEFFFELRFALLTRSSIQFGLTADRVRSFRIADTLFASTVKALAAAYNAGTPESNTILVGQELDFYGLDSQGNVSELGNLSVRVGKNAANQLLYVARWDPGAGTISGNFTIGLGLSVAWSPTDVPAAQSAGALTSSEIGSKSYAAGVLTTTVVDTGIRFPAGTVYLYAVISVNASTWAGRFLNVVLRVGIGNYVPIGDYVLDIRPAATWFGIGWEVKPSTNDEVSISVYSIDVSSG